LTKHRDRDWLQRRSITPAMFKTAGSRTATDTSRMIVRWHHLVIDYLLSQSRFAVAETANGDDQDIAGLEGQPGMCVLD